MENANLWSNQLTMRSLHFTSSRGIALFQVLLITTVIAILAIQFTQTAQNQIFIASTIVDRVQAQVNLKDAESELLFSLLTENRFKNSESKSQYSSEWNFYGKPFTANDDIGITIQDQNGLVSLYQGRSKNLLEGLINHLDIEDVSASVASNSLIDWQDGDDLTRVNGAESRFYGTSGMPTNLPLQTIDEIRNIRGFSPELVQALVPFVTIRPQTYFNPVTAPKEVLSALVGLDKANQIVTIRENGGLTRSVFEQLTAIRQDEGINFSPSGLLKINMQSSVNDVTLAKQIEILVQPLNQHPLIEYQVQN